MAAEQQNNRTTEDKFDYDLTELIDELEAIRLKIIMSQESDKYETTIVAQYMLLEGVALLEASYNKLRQAEIFKAREYAGNF